MTQGHFVAQGHKGRWQMSRYTQPKSRKFRSTPPGLLPKERVSSGATPQPAPKSRTLIINRQPIGTSEEVSDAQAFSSGGWPTRGGFTEDSSDPKAATLGENRSLPSRYVPRITPSLQQVMRPTLMSKAACHRLLRRTRRRYATKNDEEKGSIATRSGLRQPRRVVNTNTG